MGLEPSAMVVVVDNSTTGGGRGRGTRLGVASKEITEEGMHERQDRCTKEARLVTTTEDENADALEDSPERYTEKRSCKENASKMAS